MKQNITKLRIIAACTGATLYAAFDKLFMQERGLSLQEIVALEIIIATVVILTEVPSGAISDRWSRKYVLTLSSIFMACNILLWAGGHSFWSFATGAVFGALAITFKSGTNTSLLYDSLRESGKESSYARQLGVMRSVTAVAFIASAGIGGLISQAYGIELTFWATLPLIIIAIALSLTLHEPKFHRSTEEISYWQHVKKTAGFVAGRPRIMRILFLLIAVTIPMLLIDKYAQLYFSSIGVGLFGIGILAIVSGGVDALFNYCTHRLAKFQHTTIFIIGLFAMSVGLIVVACAPNLIGIVALFVVSAAFFVVAIVAETDLNHQLPSSIRATSESFFGLAETVIFMPVALLFAWTGQQFSVPVAFGTLGALLGVCLVLFLIVFQRPSANVTNKN